MLALTLSLDYLNITYAYAQTNGHPNQYLCILLQTNIQIQSLFNKGELQFLLLLIHLLGFYVARCITQPFKPFSHCFFSIIVVTGETSNQVFLSIR